MTVKGQFGGSPQNGDAISSELLQSRRFDRDFIERVDMVLGSVSPGCCACFNASAAAKEPAVARLRRSYHRGNRVVAVRDRETDSLAQGASAQAQAGLVSVVGFSCEPG